MTYGIELQLIRKRFFTRKKMLAMQVAIHKLYRRRIAVYVMHKGRNLGDSCLLCRVQSPMSGDSRKRLK